MEGKQIMNKAEYIFYKYAQVDFNDYTISDTVGGRWVDKAPPKIDSTATTKPNTKDENWFNWSNGVGIPVIIGGGLVTGWGAQRIYKKWKNRKNTKDDNNDKPNGGDGVSNENFQNTQRNEHLKPTRTPNPKVEEPETQPIYNPDRNIKFPLPDDIKRPEMRQWNGYSNPGDNTYKPVNYKDPMYTKAAPYVLGAATAITAPLWGPVALASSPAWAPALATAGFVGATLLPNLTQAQTKPTNNSINLNTMKGFKQELANQRLNLPQNQGLKNFQPQQPQQPQQQQQNPWAPTIENAKNLPVNVTKQQVRDQINKFNPFK